MAKADSKIVDMKAYLKAHPPVLKQDAIEGLVAKQRAYLRQLDNDVINLLQERGHTLKDIQFLKDGSVLIESRLVELSDWLEDTIAKPSNEKIRAENQALLKQCEQLITRNERIKKSIADDMSACRYVEGKKTLDPIKIVGFLIGTPWALVTALKTKPDPATLKLLGIGVGVGLVFAFHHQAAALCVNTGRAIANSPRRFKTLGRNVRHSVVTTTMVSSLVVGEAKGFNVSRPRETAINPKSYFAAKL